MGSIGDAVSPGDHLPSVLAVRLAREEEVRELLGPGPDELLRGVRWEGDGLEWMWAMLYFWRREYWGRVVRKVNEMAVNAASGGGQGWEAI